MKIVCISDTHNQHDRLELPPGDVLIHAGDCSMRGRSAEIGAFLAWMASQPHRHKVVVAGNHDFLFEDRRDEARAMVPPGVIYLENEGVTLDGVRFWGSPVTPTFDRWAFMRSLATIGTCWDAISEDTEVLITHGPAHGVLDRVLPKGESVGCPKLRQALDIRLNPRLHVFGHIHEGYGRQVDGNLISVNASVLDHRYLQVNAPVVVDL